VLIDHHALVEAFRQRDLSKVLQLHRSINKRVNAQSKEALKSFETRSALS
jgi:hypothetical protein